MLDRVDDRMAPPFQHFIPEQGLLLPLHGTVEYTSFDVEESLRDSLDYIIVKF